MGGGGGYAGGSVRRSGRGRTSSAATEKEMSRRNLDPACDPRDRIITCTARGPMVFSFDETGSMGDLPKIIKDKYPLIAGQVGALSLVEEPMMSVCGIGDAENYEQAPVQVGDFLTLREVGDGFNRIFLEGNGGSNDRESYDLMMYYFAYMCNLPNAVTPFFLMTGDEGYRSILSSKRLTELFGSRAIQHQDTNIERVFADLDRKFQGNFFLIRRFYGSLEERVMNSWIDLVGRGRIARLDNSTDGDKSIGDVSIGVIALATGRMSLDEYCISLVAAREEPQSEARIARVRRTLEPIAEYCANRLLPDDERVTPEEMDFAKRTATFGAPDPGIKRPPRGRRAESNDNDTRDSEEPDTKKPDDKGKKRKKNYQL